MNTLEMINELKKRGFKVEARRRTDGGWLITKINGKKFTGAKGNQEARAILGVALETKRAEQLQYNVEKFIKGSKKPKDKVDEALNKELRKVQRIWRKGQVKAKITKKKLRWHIKEGGRKEALEYLEKMKRYGKGYAYLENVENLAKYVEDVALGISDNELKEATIKVADFIRGKAELFREEWISAVYSYWYEVVANNYNGLVVSQAILNTYGKIG